MRSDVVRVERRWARRPRLSRVRRLRRGPATWSGCRKRGRGHLESVFPLPRPRAMPWTRWSFTSAAPPGVQRHHRAPRRSSSPCSRATNCGVRVTIGARAFEPAGAVAETPLINQQNLTPRTRWPRAPRRWVEGHRDTAPIIHDPRTGILRRATSPTARPSSSAPSSAPAGSPTRFTTCSSAGRPDAGHLQRLPGPHQAGPVPYGEIRAMDEGAPRTRSNTIGRHSEPSGAHARGIETCRRGWSRCEVGEHP